MVFTVRVRGNGLEIIRKVLERFLLTKSAIGGRVKAV